MRNVLTATPTPLGPGGEVAAVEVGGERLGAQFAQQPVILKGHRLPVQAAEAARIGQADGTRVVEFEIDVVVLVRRTAGRHDREVSGHAEVNDQPTRVEMHQEILGAALHRVDPLVPDRVRELDGPAQRCVADDNAAQHPPAQHRFETAPRGFDFRKFGQVSPLLRLLAGRSRPLGPT